MRHSLRLLMSLPLAALAAAAAAQNMYKWTDENGHVTYSDQPPLGKVKSSELINIPATATGGAVRQLADQNSQFKKRQEDAAKAQAATAKKEELDKQRADNCARARGELRALRDDAPIARLTESGERVLLDSNARESEGKRLETFIEESCAQVPG